MGKVQGVVSKATGSVKVSKAMPTLGLSVMVVNTNMLGPGGYQPANGIRVDWVDPLNPGSNGWANTVNGSVNIVANGALDIYVSGNFRETVIYPGGSMFRVYSLN